METAGSTDRAVHSAARVPSFASSSANTRMTKSRASPPRTVRDPASIRARRRRRARWRFLFVLETACARRRRARRRRAAPSGLGHLDLAASRAVASADLARLLAFLPFPPDADTSRRRAHAVRQSRTHPRRVRLERTGCQLLFAPRGSPRASLSSSSPAKPGAELGDARALVEDTRRRRACGAADALDAASASPGTSTKRVRPSPSRSQSFTTCSPLTTSPTAGAGARASSPRAATPRPARGADRTGGSAVSRAGTPPRIVSTRAPRNMPRRA